MTITFSIQGQPTTQGEWIALARRAEELGFETLSTADHPGVAAAPFVALAVAAGSTSRLRLASSVVNAGAWSPLALAAEVATLDLLSEGRAMLGIGAGHTPAEWTMVGRSYPSPRERIDRLIETVPAVRRLLAGREVTVRGEHVRLDRAVLRWPSPPRNAVPIVIGGNARRLIVFASEHADIVEMTGLGRTLPDGHRHEANWSAPSIAGRVEVFRRARRLPEPRLGVLVQRVEVTSDRRAAAEAQQADLQAMLPESAVPSLDDLLHAPFVLLGTEAEIIAQLRSQQAQWGLTRYTVRADALEAVGSLIERLRHSRRGTGLVEM